MAATKITKTGPNNTATLMRVDRDGVVVRSRHRQQLKLELGHYYLGKAPSARQGGKTVYGDKPKIVTATGFEYLNGFCPLSWIPKGTLVDQDGKEVGNPLIKKVDGNIEHVRIRRFAVGRSHDGTMRAYDLTLNYDPAAYFQAEIYAEFARVPYGQTGTPPPKKWGKLLNSSAAKQYCEEIETWSHVPIAPGVSLCYDITASEIQKCFREFRQRTQFADRLARTICERNIYKKHFGFATVPEDGIVTLYRWSQPDISVEQLEAGIVTRNGRIVLDDEEIEVVASEVDADLDDDETAKDDLSREQDFTPVNEPEVVDGPDPDKLRSYIGTLIRKQGGASAVSKAIAPAMKAAGVKKLADLATIDDCEKLQGIANALESSVKAKDGDDEPKPDA